MIDIKSMTIDKLEQLFAELGEPAYKARQAMGFLHRGARSFDDMTTLSKPLRARLSELAFISRCDIEQKRTSSDGTVKYLFALQDGERVEGVRMSYRHGDSLCISTQAGCRMGCAFCASTEGGLRRNLTPAEMLDQLLCAEADDGRIHSMVLMGMGEPLDNFDNVADFLRILSCPHGRCMSPRNVSLSTCGLCDGIERLAALGLPVTLSVSLHAPNDDLRSQLMPINRKYNITQLLHSCNNYFDASGRRVSFEYGIINGVNDSYGHARELAALLRGARAHLNLIPLNPVPGKAYDSPPDARISEFARLLTELGVNVTVRRRLGADIEAACGQLRRRVMNRQGPERTG